MPKTLSGAKIRYFNNELFHSVGFSSDPAEASRMAAKCRRRGYKARMVSSRSPTGKKGWAIWESHFPAKRRY